MRNIYCFALWEQRFFFNSSSPLVLETRTRVCLFPHFHLSFHGRQLASPYTSAVVRGAVTERLAVAEESSAKDFSVRPPPWSSVVYGRVCLLAQPCPPGLTLASPRGSSGPSPPWLTKTTTHKLPVALPGQPDSQPSTLASVFVKVADCFSGETPTYMQKDTRLGCGDQAPPHHSTAPPHFFSSFHFLRSVLTYQSFLHLSLT